MLWHPVERRTRDIASLILTALAVTCYHYHYPVSSARYFVYIISVGALFLVVLLAELDEVVKQCSLLVCAVYSVNTSPHQQYTVQCVDTSINR
jgi:hypothetical protein